MTRTILHILSQRPGRTGSGVTLDSLVRCAGTAGWQQHVVVGTAADDPAPQVGNLPAECVHPLVFGESPLDFPVPGMSDVMPYDSTVFSAMTDDQLADYRGAWKQHLQEVLRTVKPNVIHSHHVWILSALLKEIAPEIPVVTHCHATGLRQMVLCPHLAEEVRTGCARNERFLVLHEGHAEELQQSLAVSRERIEVVGGGFNEEHFHSRGRLTQPGLTLVYAGKFSRSKGLACLLDALEIIRERIPNVTLHVAGSGSGTEAEELRRRMEKMASTVILHGQLSQKELGELLRQSAVFVLPSFYEGFGLVIVEAVACGCRVVCTELPGVVNELMSYVGEAVDLVSLPALAGIDTPVETELPTFVANLAEAIETSLTKSAFADAEQLVARFRWEDIFRRVEQVWLDTIQ